LTTAEALALAKEIESTPGTEIAGTLRASLTDPAITGYRVAYVLPNAEGLITTRRVWVQSQQDWEPTARKLWASWGPVRAARSAASVPERMGDAPEDGPLTQVQVAKAHALGHHYAEVHTEAALEAAILHFCRQQGWASESEEADVFAFLAGAAYHGRRMELCPEEYPQVIHLSGVGEEED
jgi:hypothetical protein